jgi:prepilin-type N-terminal cleavage/methylation domain-containing protein
LTDFSTINCLSHFWYILKAMTQAGPVLQRGFTIIEVLLVMAVMAILALIALRNVSTVRFSTALNEATRTIVNTAEEARAASAGGREWPANSGTFPSFGVAFDPAGKPRDVLVFADCKLDDDDSGQINATDDFTYNPAKTDCLDESGVPIPGLVEEVRITDNPRVVIREVRTVAGATEVQQHAAAVYVRPDPTTWLSTWQTVDDHEVLPYGRIEVDVGEAGGDQKQTIRFWTSGLIDVQ